MCPRNICGFAAVFAALAAPANGWALDVPLPPVDPAAALAPIPLTTPAQTLVPVLPAVAPAPTPEPVPTATPAVAVAPAAAPAPRPRARFAIQSPNPKPVVRAAAATRRPATETAAGRRLHQGPPVVSALSDSVAPRQERRAPDFPAPVSRSIAAMPTDGGVGILLLLIVLAIWLPSALAGVGVPLRFVPELAIPRVRFRLLERPG
jgi:hypothetical protein